MPAEAWEVFIPEVENMLFFFNVLAFVYIIDANNWYWEVKCIIPTSAVKVRKYADFRQSGYLIKYWWQRVNSASQTNWVKFVIFVNRPIRELFPIKLLAVDYSLTKNVIKV